jgi:hypothetical protein
MHRMDTPHDQEEEQEMNEANIRQFMEAARYYLLGLIPPKQLATLPARSSVR